MMQPIQQTLPVTRDGARASMDLTIWSQMLIRVIEAQAAQIADLTARVEALE